MTALALLGIAVAAALSSWLLTAQVRRYALAREILDVPRARSSHTTPTHRGGGVGIVALTLLAVVVLAATGLLPRREAVGLFGGGVLVGLIGWSDDLRPRPAVLRAAVHALAALWLLAWTGGATTLRLGATEVYLGWLGNVLALGGIVWSINLYNFMDGIDGLAGGQAALAAGVGGALLCEGSIGLALLCAVVAGASLGFLWWNWSPARIFLGDVGSGFLGFIFAALALLSDRGSGPGVPIWLLLGSVFLVDATLTLGRRVLRRERWYAAHRSHAYQRAVQAGCSHRQVSLGALGLAALGAGGAWLAHYRPEWLGPAMLGQALVLLVAYLLVEVRAPMRRG